uniref:Fucolectin tachylectin-4 pentraxin-1 domain-containing protein n=1 Tax=Labrus bergylta TaxID=56723 RepID=A0A3Q3EKR7_9LABR
TWCILLAFYFTGENLALKGKASQSSLYTEGDAYFAIDGNNDNDRAHRSCSHTDTNFITNRKLRIGDSLENNGNNNPRCAVVDNIPAGATVEFQCNGMDGRYVNVFIPGKEEYLTLCEVEVYGSVLD